MFLEMSHSWGHWRLSLQQGQVDVHHTFQQILPWHSFDNRVHVTCTQPVVAEAPSNDYTNELMSPVWCKYQTDDRTSTAHLSLHLSMDYMLKLQGHTSMSNQIGMPWLYFVVLAWWFNILSLIAGSGSQQLQHFANTTMLQNCVTCGWHCTLFSGRI